MGDKTLLTVASPDSVSVPVFRVNEILFILAQDFFKNIDTSSIPSTSFVEYKLYIVVFGHTYWHEVRLHTHGHKTVAAALWYLVYQVALTLVLLNKFRCHALFKFSAN